MSKSATSSLDELRLGGMTKDHTLSSIRKFQESDLKGGLNHNMDVAVTMNVNEIPWQQGPHCMNCYLGQVHECWDPQYAKEMNDITRKVMYSGGGFDLSDAKQDGNYGVITYVVKYQPNTKRLPFHDHPHGEEYIVLKGSFDDTCIKAPAMCYVKYPNNCWHSAQPNMEEGAEILTWWGQNNNDDVGRRLPWWSEKQTSRQVQTVSINFDPKSPRWEQTEFGHILVCFRGVRTLEETKVVKIDAGQKWEHPAAPGGLEIYVLQGSFIHHGNGTDEVEYKQGWWLREPARRNGEGESRKRYFESREGCQLLVKSNHLEAVKAAEDETNGNDAVARWRRIRNYVLRKNKRISPLQRLQLVQDYVNHQIDMRRSEKKLAEMTQAASKEETEQTETHQGGE